MQYTYPFEMGPDFVAGGDHYLCLPKQDMPALAAEFVKLLELEQTNKYCTCEWVIHPADTQLAEGMRRVRKGEPALDCMVHTKEGFLLGFTHWLFYMRNQEPEPIKEEPVPEYPQAELTRLHNAGLLSTYTFELLSAQVDLWVGYRPTEFQFEPKTILHIENPMHDLKRYMVGEGGPEMVANPVTGWRPIGVQQNPDIKIAEPDEGD